MTALEERLHALYRFFSADGVLLYIGITADIPTRFRDHKAGKPWWLEIAHVAIEHFPDRASVLAAEKRAIIAEKPRWNVQHQHRPRARAEVGHGLRIYNLRDFMSNVPDHAKWHVHCDACNPHEDEYEPGVYCGGCYWFAVDRCRTWAQLIDWTAHLSEKDWLRSTNWPDFIRAIAHGTPGAGFVTEGPDGS